ncbi:MAG TPA: MFS transporter [Solimonas sp.]|nr:MFS transporter [Solimonas sp.]
MSDRQQKAMMFTVAVAALGYFVDLFDIVLFGVVRVASLNDLGITGAANTDWGIRLLNLQMIGMLIGGIAWGVVGDKLGRRTALTATILLYSLANIANGFVTTVDQYALLRFIAGVGLAGELGAGVTLVSEALPPNRRGYGTTLIAFLGLLGALTASYVGGMFAWRTAYIVGGSMGLVVLCGRYFGMAESQMFAGGESHDRGNLRTLFGNGGTLIKFLAVIAVGVPIWFVSALFVNLAPEMGRTLELTGPLSVGEVLRWQSFGLAAGTVLTGLIGEKLQSRKTVLFACLVLITLLIGVLLSSQGATPKTYCMLMLGMGLAQGYWTPFITLAAEQFGTNIRATVATSAPNFVRAMTVPVTLGWHALIPLVTGSGAVVVLGAVCLGLAFISLLMLDESYGKNLDYVEEVLTARKARELLQERRAARLRERASAGT